MKIPKANKSKLNNKEKSNILKELKIVSRSFYLTLRILPGSVFTPAGVAYLIARYIDNIVDNKSVSMDSKKTHIYEIRKTFAPNRNDLTESLNSNTNQSHTSILTYKHLFDTLHCDDQKLVSKVLLEITDGMLFELEKFNQYSPNEIKSLSTYVELDNYIYKIAGSVGEFFTELILLHEPKLRLSDTSYFFDIAIEFGKALQLTNILRDFKPDLIEGKCYFPQNSLTSYNIHPSDLLNDSQDKIEIVLNELLQLAFKYYLKASMYVLYIPKTCPRLRLAALWPLLIGIETLNKLVSSKEWSTSNKPIKVKRKWIYLMLIKSFVVIYSNTMLKFIIKRQLKHLKDNI